MEKVLGGNNYVQLKEWHHDRDPKLSYAYTQFPNSNGEEDGVSVCPVIKRKGKAHLLLAVHLRPARLHSAKSHGLALEIIAGYNKDKDAQGHSTEENAKKESSEEMGLTVRKLHRIGEAVGAGSSSKAEFVADCADPKVVKPKEPDMTELAIVSLPLENALTFIKEQSKKGLDVQDSVYKSIAEAQKIFKVNEAKKTKIEPELEWTVAGNKPNPHQEDGLKLLADKTGYLKQAAKPLNKKKKGFFARTWDNIKYFFSFKWLFSKSK